MSARAQAQAERVRAIARRADAIEEALTRAPRMLPSWAREAIVEVVSVLRLLAISIGECALAPDVEDAPAPPAATPDGEGRQCSQVSCTLPARWSYVWPGSGRLYACERHMQRARETADALGIFGTLDEARELSAGSEP